MTQLFYGSTQLFLMLASLYAAIYGSIYKNRFKEMKYLFIYPSASFAETFFSPTINMCFPTLSKIGIPDMMVNLFLLVEFLVIYHFYIQILKQPLVKILLSTVAVVYVIIMVLLWFMKNSFNKDPKAFFIPQALIILVPCFYYFYEMVRSPIIIELKSEPTFWVMLGIMIYFGCTLPLFLLDSILDFSKVPEKNVYAINCLCYGLLYLLLIKAFLCKKRKAQ